MSTQEIQSTPSNTSTSSSSNSSQAAEECVVCGEKTFKRCGPCSANGMDWMFFCSAEHQKLVWPMHKRVCGLRAKPFCIPGFSKKELDEMPYYGSREYKAEYTGKITTFLDVVMHDDGPEGDGTFKTRHGQAGGLVIFLYMLAEHTPGNPYSPDESSQIPRVRMAFWTAKLRSTFFGPEGDRMVDIIEFEKMVAKDPWNWLACLLMRKVPNASEEDIHERYPWWTTFCHRFLFVIALQVCCIENPMDPILVIYFDHAVEQITKLCREEIVKTHPKIADADIPELLWTIKGDMGTYFRVAKEDLANSSKF